MSGFKLVGIAGSFNRPSKTLALVRHVAERASVRYGFSSKPMICTMSVRRWATPCGARTSMIRPGVSSTRS